MTTRQIISRLLRSLVTTKRIAVKYRMEAAFMLRDVKRSNAGVVFVAARHGDFFAERQCGRIPTR